MKAAKITNSTSTKIAKSSEEESESEERESDDGSMESESEEEESASNCNNEESDDFEDEDHYGSMDNESDCSSEEGEEEESDDGRMESESEEGESDDGSMESESEEEESVEESMESESDSGDEFEEEEEDDDNEEENMGSRSNGEEHKSTVVQKYDDSFVIERSTFYEHFQSPLGGAKKEDAIDTMVKRLTGLLLWTYCYIYKIKLPEIENEYWGWFLLVTTKYYMTVNKYAAFLSERKKISPSTILNHLSDIGAMAKWLVHFSGRHFGAPQSIVGFEEVLKGLRRSFNKHINKNTYNGLSLEKRIEYRKYPRGGMKELQEAVLQKKEWVIKCLNNLTVVDCDIYNAFLSVMFVSFYLFSLQGRVGGLAYLRYRQRLDLKKNGYTHLEDEFKTQATYGAQPFTLGEQSRWFFKKYLRSFRPLVSLTLSGVSPMFLGYDGQGLSPRAIGLLISGFLKKECGLKMTSTAFLYMS